MDMNTGKIYDVIVLGATFAAAGIAARLGQRCLVLERGLRAGSEFVGALQFGAGYDRSVRGKEARQLWEALQQEENGRFCCDAQIYPFFSPDHTRFATEIVSVEEKDGVFQCVTHGVDGYGSFEARQVVDTRTHGETVTAKTYNLLVKSDEIPCFPNISAEKAGKDDHYVLRCPVAVSCGYAEARTEAEKVIRRFSESQRVILFAHTFDCQVSPDAPRSRDGIRYLPSKAYENPVLAFDAGLSLGEELTK